jgi:3-oxoadipate enol-lactonase
MMEPTTSGGSDLSIHVNDHTVSYDDFGKGKIPVIFIHGFPFDKSSWHPQLDALKHAHRVIAYDIRGFGKSAPGEAKAGIPLFADDLIQFMDVLGISRAILCGLSMGGYIVLDVIQRFPGRVEAIILCDTQCTADTPEAKDKRTAAIEDIKVSGLIDFAHTFIPQIFCQYTMDTKKDLVAKMTKVVLSNSADAVTGTLQALMQREDKCGVLNKIGVPALIICGREDRLTPPLKAQFLFDNIKNAEIQIIEIAGHLSNLEQPEVFNQHLADFISAL